MSRRRNRRTRTGRAALGAGLLAAILFGPPAARAAGLAGVPKGAHGAAKMESQLEELAKLLPKADVAEPPARFDPVVWAAFIAKDNALTAPRDRKSVV